MDANGRRVKHLEADPANPRSIDPENQRRLAESLGEFGDLGGIVFNRKLGLLVGGHQRREQLPPDAEVVVTERFAEPNEVGTVAVGHVLANGERWAYREVEWDLETHRLANIAANNPALQGEFHFPVLAEIVADLEARGVSAKRAGYDEADVQRMLDWTPEVEPPGSDDTLLKDPASSLGTYLTNTVKQIVTFWGNEEYGEVLDKLERIAEARGLTNNTAVFAFLLDYYEQHAGLDA